MQNLQVGIDDQGRLRLDEGLIGEFSMPYVPGDNKVVCDFCGRDALASQVKKTWDGFYVHAEHWEPRHPQDFVRAVKDDQTVKINRPGTEPTFVAEADALPLPPNPLGV